MPASPPRRTLLVVLIAILLIAGGVLAFMLLQRGRGGTAVGALSADAIMAQAGPLTLTLSKSVSPTSTTAGATVSYTINWTADGTGLASGIDIVDDYDQTKIASVSAISGGGTDDGDKITWSIAPLDFTTGPKSGSFTFAATLISSFPSLPATVSNPVAFTTLDPPGSANASADLTVTGELVLPSVPKLGIVKNVVDINGGSVKRGDSLRYTITVSNTGLGAASGVRVTDDVGKYLDKFTVTATPAGSTNASSPAPAGANGTGHLDVSGFSLSPAASATITYTVVVASSAPDATKIANVAVASDDQGERVQGEANVVVSVVAPPVTLTPTSSVSTSAAVQTPVTGIDAVVAVWLAVAAALIVAVLAYATYLVFKVLR